MKAETIMKQTPNMKQKNPGTQSTPNTSMTVLFVIAGLIFGPTAYLLTNVILDCIGPSFGVVTEKEKTPQAPSENTGIVYPETDPPSTGEVGPGTPEPDGGDPFTMLIVGTDYQPDLLTDYERISDHCSNVAVDILEDMIGSLEMHEYHLSEDYRQDDRFKEYFNEYKLRYKL